MDNNYFTKNGTESKESMDYGKKGSTPSPGALDHKVNQEECYTKMQEYNMQIMSQMMDRLVKEILPAVFREMEERVMEHIEVVAEEENRKLRKKNKKLRRKISESNDKRKEEKKLRKKYARIIQRERYTNGQNPFQPFEYQNELKYRRHAFKKKDSYEGIIDSVAREVYDE